MPYDCHKGMLVPQLPTWPLCLVPPEKLPYKTTLTLECPCFKPWLPVAGELVPYTSNLDLTCFSGLRFSPILHVGYSDYVGLLSDLKLCRALLGFLYFASLLAVPKSLSPKLFKTLHNSLFLSATTVLNCIYNILYFCGHPALLVTTLGKFV